MLCTSSHFPTSLLPSFDSLFCSSPTNFEAQPRNQASHLQIISKMMEPTCQVCKKDQVELSQPLKRCAKCLTGSYCSRVCQKADWEGPQEDMRCPSCEWSHRVSLNCITIVKSRVKLRTAHRPPQKAYSTRAARTLTQHTPWDVMIATAIL